MVRGQESEILSIVLPYHSYTTDCAVLSIDSLHIHDGFGSARWHGKFIPTKPSDRLRFLRLPKQRGIHPRPRSGFRPRDLPRHYSQQSQSQSQSNSSSNTKLPPKTRLAKFPKFMYIAPTSSPNYPCTKHQPPPKRDQFCASPTRNSSQLDSTTTRTSRTSRTKWRSRRSKLIACTTYLDSILGIPNSRTNTLILINLTSNTTSPVTQPHSTPQYRLTLLEEQAFPDDSSLSFGEIYEQCVRMNPLVGFCPIRDSLDNLESFCQGV